MQHNIIDPEEFEKALKCDQRRIARRVKNYKRQRPTEIQERMDEEWRTLVKNDIDFTV